MMHLIRRLVVTGLILFPAQPVAALSLLPSFDMQVPMPPTPVTVNGSPRLVYELHLTNFSGDTLTLQELEVIGDGKVIGTFSDHALENRMGSAAGKMSLAIPPGERGVVYLELTPGNDAVPSLLKHRVTFHRAGENRQVPETVEGGNVDVGTGPPVVLGAPLRGGPWAAIRHPAWPRGHRRVIYAIDGRARIPGRHAIDWIKLDAGGHFAAGDTDRIDNWHGYNAPVLAVADGVIVAARDDVAESETVSGHPEHALEDATGNYIALDIGSGRYVFYEHLKPGSIRVKPGERVTRGQVVASLGFTGDSTGPHLHFHVADANSPLGAEGLPFVIDRFSVLGAYESLDAFGERPWQPLDDSLESKRRKEWPAPNVVIAFPDSEPVTESADPQ